MAKKKKGRLGRPPGPGSKNGKRTWKRKPKFGTPQSHLVEAARMMHDQASVIEKIAAGL